MMIREAGLMSLTDRVLIGAVPLYASVLRASDPVLEVLRDRKVVRALTLIAWA